MFVVNDDLSLYVTRGDAVTFMVAAAENGNEHTFTTGDVVRMKVFEKNDCEAVVLQKDVTVSVATERVAVNLTGQDTKIGEVINKPKDYWYEIELNPETNPQTIVGYDDNGPKIFRLFPEGKDLDENAS